MLELINNCAHNSEFYTYIDYLNNKIIKSAFTEKGINSILREYKGLKWYIENSNIEIENLYNIILQKKNYIRFEMKMLNLKKNDYNQGLIKNTDLIEKTIKHYCEVWSKEISKKNVNLHGDLSIDNILFDNEKIFVIDWEHFAENAAPIGFDIVYLLFESLWFSMNNRKNFEINDTEKEFINLQLKFLKYKNMLSIFFDKTPLFSLKRFMVENMQIWSAKNIDELRKFPILFLNNEQIYKIDKSILIDNN